MQTWNMRKRNTPMTIYFKSIFSISVDDQETIPATSTQTTRIND